MALSTILQQTLLSEGTAGNIVSANTFLTWLDALSGKALDRTATEPGSPNEGDLYILTGTPTGTNWTGQAANDLALYYNSAWIFLTPVAATEGIKVWVADENSIYVWDGSAWGALATGGGDVVDDTTPVLGGYLYTNGYGINVGVGGSIFPNAFAASVDAVAASGQRSACIAGSFIQAGATYSVAMGGSYLYAYGGSSITAAGYRNTVDPGAAGSAIIGAQYSDIYANYSGIVSGNSNDITNTATEAFIGGGESNTVGSRSEASVSCTFSNAGATITRASGSWTIGTLELKRGQFITVSGSSSNNGTFTIQNVTATVITISTVDGSSLTNEGPVSVTIQNSDIADSSNGATIGGDTNSVRGLNGAVIGGANNTVGQYGFAAGSSYTSMGTNCSAISASNIFTYYRYANRFAAIASAGSTITGSYEALIGSYDFNQYGYTSYFSAAIGTYGCKTYGGGNGRMFLGAGNGTISGSAGYGIVSGNSHTWNAGNNSIVTGNNNTLSHSDSVVHGNNAVSRVEKSRTFAGGNFASSGDAQVVETVKRREVTHSSNAWFELTTNGLGNTAANQIPLPTDSAAFVRAVFIGTTSGITKTIGFACNAVIKNDAGTVTAVQIGKDATFDTEDTDFDARIDIDNTNKNIQVEVRDTTSGGDTVRWVAHVTATIIQYS